jgi:hypothetical protein
LYRYRNYLPAKPMSEGLGNLQTFKAPAAKLPPGEALKPRSVLSVIAVTMPSVDGVKSAPEAAVRGGNMDDEKEIAALAAGRRFLHSRRI